MAKKIAITVYQCPGCGYRWEHSWDLDFDEEERVPCCPNCKELIEDGDDD